MDVGSKKLSKDSLDARNFELSSETKVAQKGIPFILREGIMYRVGQDNRMHKCLTTSESIDYP